MRYPRIRSLCIAEEKPMKTIHGKVRGRTIEFDEDIGIADGKEVEIQVKELVAPVNIPGDGLLRTEGALADDTEWDAIMEEIHRSRKSERNTPVAELGDA